MGLMQENMIKELNDFRLMISNWKKSYLSWMEDEGNEWLVGELVEEISTFISPVIRRFRETKLITLEEEQKFWEDVNKDVAEFTKIVKGDEICTCGGNHGCKKG